MPMKMRTPLILIVLLLVGLPGTGAALLYVYFRENWRWGEDPVECDPNVLIADINELRGVDLTRFKPIKAAIRRIPDGVCYCLRLQGDLSDVNDLVTSIPAKRRFPEEGLYYPYSPDYDRRGDACVPVPPWFTESIADGKCVRFSRPSSKMELYIDTTRGDPCVIYVLGYHAFWRGFSIYEE